MKTKIIFPIVLLFLYCFNGCQENLNSNSIITPLPLMKIDSIDIKQNLVKITSTYITPNPCYYFYKTEIKGNDSVKTLKIYGKYDGEVCIQILGEIKRTDTVVFNRLGAKKIRFWQSDTTYKDTTIFIR